MAPQSDILSVLIVGCGNIAGGFDAARPPDAPPFTHAGAYSRHRGFKIQACVDPQIEKRRAFMAAWSVPQGFSTFAEAARGYRYDIVSICSPTARHADDLAQALQMRPRLVFCEKPTTKSVAETAEWVRKYGDCGVALAVNHTRRWDPSIARLRADIRSGRRGKLRTVVGHYNKGILNNGSHMFDLLQCLLGDLTLRYSGDPIVDHLPEDPTIPAWLAAGDVAVFVAAGNAQDYALFEVQFMFSSGVVSIEDGGQTWREREAKESAIFPGYRTLEKGRTFPGHDDASMLAAVENIYRHVKHGEALASTGQTALAAQSLCEKIRSNALSKQPATTNTVFGS